MAYQYLKGSLAGVEVYVVRVGTDVGRRTVVRSLPGSDAVAYEDLGKAQWLHDAEVFLLGDDHVAQAKALIKVFERPGPYNFVHPLFGPRQVVLSPGQRPRVDHVDNELRRTSVRLPLVEVTTAAVVPSKPSTKAALAAAAAGVYTVASSDLAKKWSTAGAILASVVSTIGTATTYMKYVKRKALGPLAIVDTLDNTIDDFQAAAEDLAGAPADLAAGFNQIVSEIFQAIGLFTAVGQETYPGEQEAGQTSAAVAGAADTFDLALVDEPAYDGAPPDTRLTNQRALEQLLKAGALAGACNVFADVAPPSLELADYVVEAVGELAGQLLGDATVSQELHAAVRDVRDALLERIDEQRAALPEVRTFEPTGAVPAILIAWQVHGDPTRALEIVARNKVFNPAFVSQPVEVVVDG